MSIQASEWARRQYVGDAHGKALLRAIADYANEDGLCWPSVARLAHDTEISEPGVRRKIKDLDAAGFLTKTKTWMDDQGRRNHEGRGRETSSDLRLIFSKMATKPEPGSQNEGYQADSLPDQADNPPLSGTDTLEPSVEEERKNQPQTPSASAEGAFEEKKVEEKKEDQEFERDWTEFRSAGYPDGIIDVDAARRELRKLPHETRRKAIDGVPAYADYCRRRRQKSKAAHLYLRKRVWEGLSAAPAAQSSPTNHPPNSPAGRALANLARIARYNLWRLSDGSIPYQGSITPKILAFADAPDPSFWRSYPHKSGNYAAYRRLLDEVFDGRPLPSLAIVEAPWPFPPREDGTIGPQPPSTDPPRPTLTDDDQDYIAQNGL